MIIKSTITGIALTILFSCCNNNQVTSKGASNQEAPSSNNIEIHLLPAFNNSSIIKIDRLTRMVYYNVDTAMGWIKEKPAMFKCSLDSFERNTLVESFYLQNFLDSIKVAPGNWATDGLTIYTVVKRNSMTDTIISGNVYPATLGENIASQIKYILKNTSDTPLLNYIKDLKTYSIY